MTVVPSGAFTLIFTSFVSFDKEVMTEFDQYDSAVGDSEYDRDFLPGASGNGVNAVKKEDIVSRNKNLAGAGKTALLRRL